MLVVQAEALVLVELAGVEVGEPAHVGTEDVFADEQEEQGAESAGDKRDEHVLGVVDVRAGHGFIGAHHGEGGLLEGNERHAHLGGVNDAEHHHGGVAVALLVAAHVAHAVQDAPADDGGRGGAGQAAEQHDGTEKGVGEEPRFAGYGLTGDEPQRDELGEPVIVDGGAEHEDEEHHDHDGVAEALVEQQAGLHAADEHEAEQAGDAGPDDINEDPAVEHAEEHADEVHPQRGERFDGGKLPEAEHDGKADDGVYEIHDIRLFGRGGSSNSGSHGNVS